MSSTYFETEGSNSGRRMCVYIYIYIYSYGMVEQNMKSTILSVVLVGLEQYNQHNRRSSTKNNKYQLLYIYGCTS